MASLSVFTIDADERLRRIRLTTSLALYGGALGAATILISLLNRTKGQTDGLVFLEPEHMGLAASVFFSLGGGIAGVLVALPLGYLIGARATEHHNLLVWWGIGLAFGVALPFLTGALSPLSEVFVLLSLDIIQPGDLFDQVVDAAIRAPLSIVVNGIFSLYTGLLAGALFGTGGWVVDMFNGSTRPVASKVGPWAIALILGSVAVLIAVFGSPNTLEKLG